MSANDRLTDLKLGGAFLVWNVGKFPVTCLVMFAQAICYAAARLSETGRLPIHVQVWFWQIYENRLLSLEAMEEQRYYTLATNILFLADFFELVFAWVGLWFILSYVEYICGKLWSILVILLPCVAANAAFLLFAHWHAQEINGVAATWQIELLNVCRPERAYNVIPWRTAPLWLAIGVFGVIRVPTIRLIQNSVPIWYFVIAFVAIEFTLVRWHHGQFYARECLAASALMGGMLAIANWLWTGLRCMGVKRPSNL